MLQNSRIIIGLVVFIIAFSLLPNTYSETLEKKCIPDNGLRELDFGLTTGIEEFNEPTKQVKMSVDVYVKDRKTTNPIDLLMTIYPSSGGRTIQEKQNSDGYEKSERFTVPQITPFLDFPLSLWPFEQYHVPIFLQVNGDVKLCYLDSEKQGYVSSYKAGYFPNNPDWQVNMNVAKSTPEEMQAMMPNFKPAFSNSTIIKFDTVISHDESYKEKNIFYILVPIIPIILIAAHLLFIRSQKLEIQIGLFTGTTILILTSLFAIKPSIPNDLTLIEVISLTSVAFYAVVFFIILGRLKKSKNIYENEYLLATKPYNFHERWKGFSIGFWILMIILVIAFVIFGWNDAGTMSSKIADVAGVLGLFFSAYVALWAYGVERERKDLGIRENEYYKINVNDNLFSLGLIIDSIFKPNEFKNLKTDQMTAFYDRLIANINEKRKSVLDICSELIILNLNPHIPADLKDIVCGLILTTRKTVSTIPELNSLNEHYALVLNITNMMEKFYAHKSLSDIDELKKKYGVSK